MSVETIPVLPAAPQVRHGTSVALAFVEPVVVPPAGQPWRIADLYALSGDERRFELVRGNLLMMSPASPFHGRYLTRLSRELDQFVEDHNLGEVYSGDVGFILQPEPDAVVRAPDIAFVRSERIPPADKQDGFWPIAPDLAVEVISPSEGAELIEEKIRDYFAAGTNLVWLVYPRRRWIVEHTSDGRSRSYSVADTLTGGDLLPGFSCPLTRIFREK